MSTVTTKKGLQVSGQNRVYPSAKILATPIVLMDMFLILWPWPWPDDLDIRTRPRYAEDVLVHQKWKFRVKAFDI